MIRIAITAEAFEANRPETLALGSVGYVQRVRSQ
jgi:hypothetical protein